MGFLDFLWGKKNENPAQSQQRSSSTRPSLSKTDTSLQSPSMAPVIFQSNCHQRYENGREVMGLQQCIRTIRVEKNINGCRGYRLAPGDGYIVKIYNDDLGKPNMSDKPMRIINQTDDKVELQGFPIDAQTPFGWQEVDYRDYGFTIYYNPEGGVSKCVLHMFDRNIDIEYRRINTKSEQSVNCSVKSISQGSSFNLNFDNVTIMKCFYNQSQEEIKLSRPISATIQRTFPNGSVTIVFSDLSELKQRGIRQSNLSISPRFAYKKDAHGNEFASAEINSYSATTSNEYISLFQITNQNGKLVSFLINNLSDDQDFYYLIILKTNV